MAMHGGKKVNAAVTPLDLPTLVFQHLYAAPSEAAQALANMTADKLREGLHHSGHASLLVSGGRTPTLFQDRLSEEILDWGKTTVSLTDDRWLEPSHADSNERLVRQHLLKGPAAAARFIPLADATTTVEKHLRVVEQALQGVHKPYDAVVLGVGEDGHTASLFPDAEGITAALDLDKAQRVAAITSATAPYPRISMTLRALLETKAILILIQGEAKRVTIENAGRRSASELAISAILKQEEIPVHLYYSP